MATDTNVNSDSTRLTIIETRMDNYVTREEHERAIGDIRVALTGLQGEISNLRTDIKNLTWQIAVIVAILSSVISFLVSRIPL